MADDIPLYEIAPLYEESEDTVNGRLLDPFAQDADPSRRFDVSEGSPLYDMIEPVTLEFVRMYERINQAIAINFIRGAWGDYLDQHGFQLDTPRNGAEYATVLLTFEGEPDTVIPEGNRFTVPATDTEDEFPIEFAALDEVTIPIEGIVSVDAIATEPGVIGNVSANRITFPVDEVEGLISIYNSSPSTGGADAESDASYRARLIEAVRSTSGAGNAADYAKWAKEVDGVGDATVYPLWDGPGTVRVVVFGPGRTVVPSSVVRDVQEYLDPSVVLVAAMEGGEGWTGSNLTDVSKDEGNTSLRLAPVASTTAVGEAPISASLAGLAASDELSMWVNVVSGRTYLAQVRILLEDTSGRQAYRDVPTPASTLSTGEQRITWTPASMVVAGGFEWGAINKVVVSVTVTSGGDAEVYVDTVRYYDVDGGRGKGAAPIGSQVTVSAPRAIPITITATLTTDEGFTPAGLTLDIEDRLYDYFLNRIQGSNLVTLAEVANVIYDTIGVQNYSGLTINGASTDLVLADVEVPVLSAFVPS